MTETCGGEGDRDGDGDISLVNKTILMVLVMDVAMVIGMAYRSTFVHQETQDNGDGTTNRVSWARIHGDGDGMEMEMEMEIPVKQSL